MRISCSTLSGLKFGAHEGGTFKPQHNRMPVAGHYLQATIAFLKKDNEAVAYTTMPTNSNKKIILFSDAATSAQYRISVGGYIWFHQQELASIVQSFVHVNESAVYIQVYTSKKSTWCEIKTIIDALRLIRTKLQANDIIIYTDCQNFYDLVYKRRVKLEKNNFRNKKGQFLQHKDLYQDLFNLINKFNYQIIKLKGHDKIVNRTSLEATIFMQLDKIVRRKLRDLTKIAKDEGI